MTRTEAMTKLGELLNAVEVLRADKPIGPVVAETVRGTALRIVDSYVTAAGVTGPNDSPKEE